MKTEIRKMGEFTAIEFEDNSEDNFNDFDASVVLNFDEVVKLRNDLTIYINAEQKPVQAALSGSNASQLNKTFEELPDFIAEEQKKWKREFETKNLQ